MPSSCTCTGIRASSGCQCKSKLGYHLPALSTISPRYDAFYTLPWARDLRVTFPFLEIHQDIHPYSLHCYLWRLSFAFGQAYAHLSLSYEELVDDFAGTFKRLLSDLAIEGVDLERLGQLNRGPVPARWPDYADEGWFSAIEAECERTLRIYFARAPLPS
jgi:hypothetical protein